MLLMGAEEKSVRQSSDGTRVTGALKLHVELMTPERAGELLKNNHGNRPLRAKTLRQYADDMRQGLWQLTGDTIKIARDGRVLDGQHRLLAVIESGAAVMMVVAYDVPEAAFDVLDSGCKRGIGDQLHATGESNGNAIAAALAWVMIYEKTGHMARTYRVTTAQTRAALERHPEIRDSIVFGAAMRKRVVPSLASALHYLFSRRDREAADVFWRDLAEGSGLQADDAVFILRERLLENERSKTRLLRVQISALIIKAWNARRTGRKVGTLRWRGEVEEFPTIA